MRLSVDLPVRGVKVETGPHGPLTAEQTYAVERRDGRLLVTANAGAGKTLVLVERFVRDVIESEGDERPISCSQILAITFTRKAAGELRARIRERFAELGRRAEAREVERAWILTIDGFCLRVLRSHAVLAGLDPSFVVLDEPQARELAELAFADALEDWLGPPRQPRTEALRQLAAYGYDELRDAIHQIYDSLRSAGHERPAIPPVQPGDAAAARARLANAADRGLAELRGSGAGGVRVDEALERLARCRETLAGEAEPEPAEVRAWRPARQGAALTTDAINGFREAICDYAGTLEDALGAPQLALVGELLERYGRAFNERKARANALDYTDLALRTRALLTEQPAVAAGYRARLRRVMVDEFQDTNALQVSLIEALGIDDVLMVGDALQSIYGFRHADVEVFVREYEARVKAGESAALAANFRSRRAILELVNAAFGGVHGGVPWTPLTVPERGGRDERDPVPADVPVVELLVTDDEGWAADETHRGALLAGLPPATRPSAAAEALLVAQRVRELVDSGEASAGEIVVLVRAGAQLPLLERAIERAGLAAVAAQGRGWWARLEVLDLIAHLRLLVNPRDEEGLCGALTAFAGASHDGLALLALDRDAARAGGDGHASLRDAFERAIEGPPPGAPTARLDPAELGRLRTYGELLDRERRASGWAGPGELIARVVAATGYDRVTLARAGGARRLANVRKLVRLAHEFERGRGGDLRAFLDHAARELEARTPMTDAPVEVGADSAVRLMTIHAAKGLEFPVVVVADLGRGGGGRAPRVLVDGDRAGLRVTTLERERFDALDYGELKDERARRERGEERRVIHVAVTRAKRRLILSGVACLDPGDGWQVADKAVPPIRWMAPLMLPADVLARLSGVVEERVVLERDGHRAELRLAVNSPRTVGQILRIGDRPDAGDAAPLTQLSLLAPSVAPGGGRRQVDGGRPENELPALPGTATLPGAIETPAPPQTVSYTSLSEYARCGYRWYLDRVLRLPRRDAWDLRDVIPQTYGEAALRRGTIAHLLLERQSLDAGAAPPDADVVRLVASEAGSEDLTDEQVADQQRLVAAFLDGPLRSRLSDAQRIEREVPFALALAHDEPTFPLLTGSIDLLAHEASDAMLVVDYKTDRVEPGAVLADLVTGAYGLQRAAYALACLRSGAARAEVAHVYLERPDEPVIAGYAAADSAALEALLRGASEGLRAGRFAVTERPYAGLCATCPGRGGLCSHPDELTGRATP
jgi:ATP-dependent exoDNAse (exonuclease V) beta subunit